MNAVEKVLQDFLAAFEKVKGVQARKHLEVLWTGGTQVVIRNVVSNRGKLVRLGTLRLMTEQLGRIA